MINTNQKLMIHNPPFILMSHPRGWHLFQNSYIFKDAQLLGWKLIYLAYFMLKKKHVSAHVDKLIPN